MRNRDLMSKIRADQLVDNFSNADIPLHGKSHTKVMHRATIIIIIILFFFFGSKGSRTAINSLLHITQSEIIISSTETHYIKNE
jgi:hypothetical protein